MSIKTKFELNEEVLLKNPEKHMPAVALTSKLVVKGILLDSTMNIQYVLNTDNVKSVIFREKDIIKGHIVNKAITNYA